MGNDEILEKDGRTLILYEQSCGSLLRNTFVGNYIVRINSPQKVLKITGISFKQNSGQAAYLHALNPRSDEVEPVPLERLHQYAFISEETYNSISKRDFGMHDILAIGSESQFANEMKKEMGLEKKIG